MESKYRTGATWRASFLMLVCLCLSGGVEAQEELFGGHKHKVGLSAGYGFNEKITSQTGYYYRVTFFTFQYQYTFYSRNSFGIDLLAEAQYNLTDYIYDVVWIPDKKKGIEFGIHPGIVFRKNFWEDELSIYAALVIGPHYITGSLNRQASGFIFSDNLIVGMDIRLAGKLYMDLNVGFRHISPAGLTYPHDGINNIFVNAGLIYLLHPKSQKTNSN